jgi:hypothetical protein
VRVEPPVDDAGQTPAIALTAPTNAQTLPRGPVVLRATASDDVAVASVRFSVNGKPVYDDPLAPFEFVYEPEEAEETLLIEAAVMDWGGRSSTANAQVFVASAARKGADR